MTIEYVPVARPLGTTNLICEELTAKSPHAAPLMDTETPFNSIGSAGARFASEALASATVTLAGARLTLAFARASSPAAKPVGTYGVGLGLTLGLGDGLGDGLGVGLALGVGVGLATGTGS